MIWLVYYSDFSGFVVFDIEDELNALRYAVKHNMQIIDVQTGVDIREFLST